ncbi:MAG: hypothetical protein J0I18_22980 [Actinobacteria bacterium]|nr:hypothetical protein [Actinomycetota bacterium]
MRRILAAAVAGALAVGLTACASPSDAQKPTASHSTIPKPTPTGTGSTQPADLASTSDLGIAIYDEGTYLTGKDSGYAAEGSSTDAFPMHSRVQMVRVSLDGSSPAGEVDVTGLTVRDSRWEGDANLAVLDANEGPAHARSMGLPWMAEGAFDPSSKWKLTNHKLVNFLLAFYVPTSATVLHLVVNVPSQQVPVTLNLTLASD